VFLLDINILLALADPQHPHRSRALAFFPQAQAEGWAMCPLTENGFLRILGHPNYPGGPGSPDLARPIIKSPCTAPGHQFWVDAISLCDSGAIPVLPPSKDLTDAYLLALAAYRKGRFATFDHRVKASAIPGVSDSYFPVP
jgi:toxin-antitoxin system PIN domain toxin